MAGAMGPEQFGQVFRNHITRIGILKCDTERPGPEIQSATRYRKYEIGELRADGQPGFNTPTGKLEITSEWFRSFGYEPLPVYTEPKEGLR